MMRHNGHGQGFSLSAFAGIACVLLVAFAAAPLPERMDNAADGAGSAPPPPACGIAPEPSRTDSQSDPLPWISSGDWSGKVPSLSQNELGMYGGCEVVSAAAMMRAFGYGVSADMIAASLTMSDEGNFVDSYAGSPYGAGAGYPPVISSAMNQLTEQISSLRGNVSAYVFAPDDGADIEELISCAEAGAPCLVWTTMSMQEPDFTGTFDGEHEWYSNEHCVVLVGGDAENGTVMVMDPLDGETVERDRDAFAEIYAECGEMCVRASRSKLCSYCEALNYME